MSDPVSARYPEAAEHVTARIPHLARAACMIAINGKIRTKILTNGKNGCKFLDSPEETLSVKLD
jgi:hypothetical protein